MPSNKKISVDVGVNFKTEGQQLEQYIQKAKNEISGLRKITGKENDFKGTEDAIGKVSQLMSKISSFKLNTENYTQFIKLENQMRDALSELDKELIKDKSSFDEYSRKAKEAKDTLKELEDIKANGKNANKKYTLNDGSEISPQLLGRKISSARKQYEEAQAAVDNYSAAINQSKKIEQAAIDTREKAKSSLVDTAKVARESAQAEAESNRQDTINAIKQKIQYYTSLAFSIQLVRQQLRKIVDTFQEVDKTITSISMVSGISRNSLWGNIGEYNKLAQELGTTTDQVLKASQLYYQQGRNTIEVIELTRESLTLAALAGLDTEKATNYLTAAVNGFKMAAQDAGEVTDVWAQLAAKNAVSVEELAISISKVASIAQSAGMDIQSTSAFLTQMIATTREAPENLGTALKTIIARFQELKTSTEGLEDGVDANKVEKALRTVGIELRDTTGQFRDFDDVILELSSKWDTLDRNTQRYIATIAAGSRQQSRFIALVSDYDGLVEIMDQAANAEGAASEQFEVYSSGMEAALNRVKSAWQGFYLSWQDGHNVITGVLNSVSGLLNAMSKIGIIPTAGLAALSGYLVKIGTGFLFSAKSATEYFGSLKIVNAYTKITNGLEKAQVIAEKGLLAVKAESIGLDASSLVATKANEKATKSYTRAQIRETVAKMLDNGTMDAETAKTIALALAKKNAARATELLNDAILKTGTLTSVGVIAGITAALVAMALVIRKTRVNIQDLKDDYTDFAEKANNAQQNIKTAQDYIKNVEAAVEAGEDFADVRQQIIDSFGAVIEGVDVETASWNELTSALDRYIEKQKEIAAGNALNAAQTQYEIDRQEYADDRTRHRGGVGARENAEAKKQWDQEHTYGDYLSSSQAQAAALGALSASDIEASTQNVNALAEAMRNVSVELISWDEKKGFQIVDEEAVQEIIDFGNLSNATIETLRDRLEQATTAGAQQYLQNLINTLTANQQLLTDQLNKIFGENVPAIFNSERLTDSLKSSLGVSFASLGEDNELKQQYAGIIEQLLNSSVEVSPELFEKIAQVVKDGANGFEEYYETLIHVGEDGQVVISDLAAIIGGELREANEAFVEGKTVVDDYLSELDLLKKGTESMTWQEMSDWINQVSADYQRLGFETEAEAQIALWNNVVHEQGNSFKQAETGILDTMSLALYSNSEEERKNALAKIDNAIADTQKAETEIQNSIDSTKAVITSLQAKASAGAMATEAEIESANQTIQANNDILTSLQPLQEAAGDAPIGVAILATSANTKSVRGLITRLEDSLGTLEDAKKILQVREAKLNAMRGYLSTPLNAPSFSTGGGGGGGGGSSNNSTKVEKESDRMKKALDKLKDKVDELKDAAKDAADAAKAELEAITDRLKKQKEDIQDQIDIQQKALKAAQEEAKWRAEVWVEYLQGRLDDLKDELDKEKDLLDQNNDDLNNVAKAYQDAYDLQIDGIQAKIDALDKEAEAEDRLRKLQEARDAYERSRNQRTRLVLTQGAGWIFKTDTEALNQARDGLKDAQRDYQKTVLQDEIDKIQEQKDKWAEVAENIGKSAEELAAYKKALEDAFAILESGGGDDKLAEFADKVSANNQRVDFVNGLEEEYNKQTDEKEEGSIAQQIADLQKEIDKIGWDLDDFREAAKKEEYKNELLEASNRDVSQLGQTTNSILHGIDDFVNGYLYDSLSQIKSWEDQIESIDKLVDQYNDLKDRIGKSTEELEKQQALTDKYGKLTNEQLGENSKSWNELLKMINASTKAQDDYEKKKLEYDKAQKAYNDQKEKEDAAEAGASATPGDSSGGSGSGGSGSSTTTSGSGGYDPSKQSGGASGPSTGTIYKGSMANFGTGSGSNKVENVKNTNHTGSSPVGSGSNLVATTPTVPKVSTPTGLAPVGNNNIAKNNQVNNYNVSVQTQANTFRALVSDITRLAKVGFGAMEG